MKRSIGALCAAMLFGGALSAASPDADAAALAQASAKIWLAETDSGKYGDSWDHASAIVKNAISKPDWEKTVSSARGPLGAVVSRKVRSATYTKTLPGAPDGEYVVILYDTSFAKKAAAVETVTPAREKDGSWKVAGYYIR